MEFKPCPVQLSFKLEEDDKQKMAAAWRSGKEGRNLTLPPSSKSAIDVLPSSKYLQGEEDGWTVFNGSILYVYAGKGPYVGRYTFSFEYIGQTISNTLWSRSDMMAFPVSLPDDGLIDVMTMSRVRNERSLAPRCFKLTVSSLQGLRLSCL